MVRKRKPDDPMALQVRMTEGLHVKLVEAAEANSRSLNSEIVWRLGQSFGEDEWGKQAEEKDQRLKEKIREVMEEFMAKRKEEGRD